MDKDMILEQLRKAIQEYDVDQAKHFSEEAIKGGLDPTEIIKKGPAVVLKEIGEKFACGELFLPELVAAGQAGEASLNGLKQKITKRSQTIVSVGKVVI